MKRLLLILLVGVCACDGATVRESDDPIANLRNDVTRLRISPDGMSALYEASSPEGLMLLGSPSAFLVGNQTVQLGPIDAALPVAQRTFQPADGIAATLTRVASFRTFVPIRIKNLTETRICKFEVTASEIDIVAAVGVEFVDDVQVLLVRDVPTIASGALSIAPFGPCETNIDLETLVEPVENYVLQALVESTGRALETPIIESLGLLDGSIEIRPPAGFSTRNGEMIISQIPASSGIMLSEGGVSLSTNARVVSERAVCVPPISPSQFSPIPADDITTEALEDHGADLGLAISLQTLTTIAEGVTLSGLGCYDVDGPLAPLNRNDAALTDVALGNVPVDSTIAPVVIPGSLPTLEPNVDTNRITLRFPSITVEAHGDVFGVKQKLIGVDAQVEFVLAVRPIGGGLRFNIESIDVQDAVATSKWTNALPEDTSDWVRRFLLVTLANRFSFQLPIAPEFPVRALESEIRANDIALYIAIGD